MSTWDDRFREHPVHEGLKNAQSAVRKLTVPEGAIDSFEARARLERALERVQEILAAADTALVPPAIPDSINGAVAPLIQQVEYAEGQPEADHLQSANDYADGMLQAAGGIIQVTSPEEIEKLQESATRYRQSIGQLLRHLREDAKGITAEVEGLKGDLAETRDDIAAQKSRLDQALNEFQETLSTERRDHEERFQTTLDQQVQAITHAGNEFTAAAANQRGTLQGEAEELLERLRKLVEDAQRQADAIAGVGMAGGYQQVADDEKKQADRWRWIAAGSAALAILLNIGLVFAAAFEWIDQDNQWDHQIPRVLVTLSLLALASYAGIESSRHRRRQEVNRQMEKELVSLEPYMALWDDAEKKATKKEKFDIFFQGRTTRPLGDTSEDRGTEDG